MKNSVYSATEHPKINPCIEGEPGESIQVWSGSCKASHLPCRYDGKEVFSTKLKANTLPGIFSTATLDEQTGKVILKIANTSTEHMTAKINLQGKEFKNGKLIRLSAKNGLEENTIDNPTNIYPVENYVTTEKNGATVEIPANSLSIIRLK